MLLTAVYSYLVNGKKSPNWRRRVVSRSLRRSLTFRSCASEICSRCRSCSSSSSSACVAFRAVPEQVAGLVPLWNRVEAGWQAVAIQINRHYEVPLHFSLAEVDALAAATPVGECFFPPPQKFYSLQRMSERKLLIFLT